MTAVQRMKGGRRPVRKRVGSDVKPLLLRPSIDGLTVEEEDRLSALDESIGELQDTLATGIPTDSDNAAKTSEEQSASPSQTEDEAKPRLTVKEKEERRTSAQKVGKEYLFTELLRKKDEQLTLVLKREKIAIDKMRQRVKELESRLNIKDSDRQLARKVHNEQDDRLGSLQKDQKKLLDEFNQARSMQEMQLFMAKSAKPEEVASNEDPPIGEVALAFTDVQNSTHLWDQATSDMMKALQIHNSLMRKLICEHGGYEVKTEGDAFMVAFRRSEDAVAWALQVQLQLLEQNWPARLYSFDDANCVRAADTPSKWLWRGLRVRMGIHVGHPTCQTDPLTKRMDYFGPMVNTAARVAGCARGGEIVCSGEVHAQLMANRKRVHELEMIRQPLGMKRFKGVSTEVECWRLVPRHLEDRSLTFATPALPPQPQQPDIIQVTSPLGGVSSPPHSPLGDSRSPVKSPLARSQNSRANTDHLNSSTASMRGITRENSSRTFLDWVVREEARREEEPPEGELALVFTDVQSSTNLWDTRTAAMYKALALHNNLMRHLIRKNGGYEVKTEGDAFMVAFPSPAGAVGFVSEAQMELLELEWPEELYSHPSAAKEKDAKGKTVWSGLRVRCGIHWGRPEESARDPVTKRMDYFGPMVNLAARVGGCAHGGEIVVSETLFKAYTRTHSFKSSHLVVTNLGEKRFKGVTSPMVCYRVTPEALVGRSFETPSPSPGNDAAQKQPSVEQQQSEESFINMARGPDNTFSVKMEEALRLYEACQDVLEAVNTLSEGSFGLWRQNRNRRMSVAPAKGPKPPPSVRRKSLSSAGRRRSSDQDKPRERKESIDVEQLRVISRDMEDCGVYLHSMGDNPLRRLFGEREEPKFTVAFGSTVPRRPSKPEANARSPSPRGSRRGSKDADSSDASSVPTRVLASCGEESPTTSPVRMYRSRPRGSRSSDTRSEQEGQAKASQSERPQRRKERGTRVVASRAGSPLPVSTTQRKQHTTDGSPRETVNFHPQQTSFPQSEPDRNGGEDSTPTTEEPHNKYPPPRNTQPHNEEPRPSLHRQRSASHQPAEAQSQPHSQPPSQPQQQQQPAQLRSQSQPQPQTGDTKSSEQQPQGPPQDVSKPIPATSEKNPSQPDRQQPPAALQSGSTASQKMPHPPAVPRGGSIPTPRGEGSQQQATPHPHQQHHPPQQQQPNNAQDEPPPRPPQRKGSQGRITLTPTTINTSFDAFPASVVSSHLPGPLKPVTPKSGNPYPKVPKRGSIPYALSSPPEFPFPGDKSPLGSPATDVPQRGRGSFPGLGSKTAHLPLSPLTTPPSDSPLPSPQKPDAGLRAGDMDMGLQPGDEVGQGSDAEGKRRKAAQNRASIGGVAGGVRKSSLPSVVEMYPEHRYHLAERKERSSTLPGQEANIFGGKPRGESPTPSPLNTEVYHSQPLEVKSIGGKSTMGKRADTRRGSKPAQGRGDEGQNDSTSNGSNVSNSASPAPMEGDVVEGTAVTHLRRNSSKPRMVPAKYPLSVFGGQNDPKRRTTISSSQVVFDKEMCIQGIRSGTRRESVGSTNSADKGSPPISPQGLAGGEDRVRNRQVGLDMHAVVLGHSITPRPQRGQASYEPIFNGQSVDEHLHQVVQELGID